VSYVWTFECNTCEEVGPWLRRSAGGAALTDEATAFLVGHEFHDVRLCGENCPPSWVVEAQREQINRQHESYVKLVVEHEAAARSERLAELAVWARPGDPRHPDDGPEWGHSFDPFRDEDRHAVARELLAEIERLNAELAAWKAAAASGLDYPK